MEQLTRLKINKYRHIKPGTELRFNGGYNVLLGKNGTGKTTLLDLISIVISSDFSPLRSEVFDLEYGIELPPLSLNVRVRNEHAPKDETQPRALRQPEEMQWFVDAQIQHSAEGKSYEVVLTQEKNIISDGVGTRELIRIRDIFQGGFELTIHLLVWARLYGSLGPGYWDPFALCRFDEALEIFDSIFGEAPKRLRRKVSAALGFTLVNDHPIEFFSHQGFYSVELSNLVERVLREDLKLTSCEFTEQQVEFLRDLAELIQASSIEMKLSLDERSAGESPSYYFKIREFVIEYPDGRYLTHEKLSYGQKRLLAFLYYLAANEKFVIADELTDSFHHEWIEFCMKKMAGRQCFLSSQNPILLDYLPIGSEEEAKKTFIQCRLEREGDKEWMVWRNLTDEDAHEFYEDLKTGVQYISEILMSRGLW